MSGEPEQGFKRDMSVEAAVVAKDEFVEIGVDVFAAQAMICRDSELRWSRYPTVS